MIELAGVTVSFGAVRPLDRLSVTFGDAACGLTGPNGAGKTTLLNVLSGFVAPSEGAVRIDGENILGLRAHQRARWGVRRTFQTEQAIATLSVADNVRAVYEQSSSPRQRQRAAVAEALDFVGLSEQRHTLAGALNGAQRRLVELARAVVGSPRVILLDEPAAGLTEEETCLLGETIAAIPERTGAQFLLIDHDMELVMRCCTTTAVLDHGSLLAQGPTAQVLRDPRVVRAYLGDEEIA